MSNFILTPRGIWLQYNTNTFIIKNIIRYELKLPPQGVIKTVHYGLGLWAAHVLNFLDCAPLTQSCICKLYYIIFIDIPYFMKLKCPCLCPCLKSCEDAAPQMEGHEQEEDDEEEDTEGETKCEQVQAVTEEEEERQQREEDREVEREEDECADYPECTLLGFRENDGETSLDLKESPRPLSQETRNLTASELLLNKSVHTR